MAYNLSTYDSFKVKNYFIDENLERTNMPEGPSIVILKEAVQSFIGKKIIKASGNTDKISFGRLRGTKIEDFKSWGKHFLICLPTFTIRLHLLMFGTYRINEKKINGSPRLSLTFNKNEQLNFYTCAVEVIEGPLDEVYDWSGDVMNSKWNSAKALKKLKANPDRLVADALLDQQMFAGVGNIIKNEVLFRIRVHPRSKVGNLSLAKKRELLREAVSYSFDFLDWKKAGALKKQWQVYTKKKCPRDGHSIEKDYIGKTNRRTFFCPSCQKLY